MSPWTALVIAAAGLVAGFINTVVGSGSLITFPTLLAVGMAPVVANVSNTVGLVPGSLSGTIGYRRELDGQRRRLVVLASASVAGALTGGVLLLALPGSVFKAAVPVLVAAAAVMMALQPRLSRRMERRDLRRTHGGAGLYVGVLLTGVYGGYFGAAQGVILISLLAIFIDDQLQRLNAAKNVLATVANGVAALLFIALGHVDWAVAGLIAAGAVVGGQLGAHGGRRLPPDVLRIAVVVVGLTVAVVLAVLWR
jgi:uncharacterized membrane protein YfcA